MIEYNVVGGKLNRGITVLAVQRTLKAAKTKDPKAKLTSLETARASVLGWAIEWLQAFFLVADDVMDDSEERRGNPCW
jgi:farnesyl diphosphate synthase